MMSHSTKAPTKEEKRWMRAIQDYGCIVCRMQGLGATPAAVHHIKGLDGQRMGHLYTIPLCDPGHHQNGLLRGGVISRHPDKARFEAAYGTEMELLDRVRRCVDWNGTMVETEVKEYS